MAEWCARNQVVVVSGGARGVDQMAMASALQAGGMVIGVLAEHLLKKSVAGDARRAIGDGRLLLMSAYRPDARFTVWNAMSRNKHIYAMADMGLVVSSDYKKGGTWEGATEELGMGRKSRPVFVRLTAEVPKGNRKLLELGGHAFPEDFKDRSPGDLRGTINAIEADDPESQPDLFSYAEQNGSGSGYSKSDLTVNEAGRSQPSNGTIAESVYEAVLPVILDHLDKPRKAPDLAKELKVSTGQLQNWLKQAVGDGKVKKLTRPVRYQRAS